MHREKYAHLEIERRFLLHGVPGGLRGGVRVEDRYLEGTLRLRRAGDVCKLGQKVRLDPGHPSRVWHTTIYLSPEEFSALLVLPGHDLVKVRHEVEGSAFSVDVFEGTLAGLVMAEAEFEDGPTRRAALAPPGALLDVTDDERFSGGALARTTRPALLALLAEHGVAIR